MSLESIRIATRPFNRGRAIVLGAVAAVACGFLFEGCAEDKHRITPTTLGTDFRRVPRGKMKPFPWPGVDLARTSPPSTRVEGPGTVDPEAATASGEHKPR